MRSPLQILKAAVRLFEKNKCSYCLIGGHAASIYRKQERLTRDIDFCLVAEPFEASRKLAEKVIKDLGLVPVVGFIPPSPHEKKRRSVCLITCKPKTKDGKGIVDILLPVLPWIQPAVKRAQYNKINIGFGEVPVITPEDLIVAKCFALRNSPDRFQDLDDLREIFLSLNNLDKPYLKKKLKEYGLSIPDQIKKYAKMKV